MKPVAWSILLGIVVLLVGVFLGIGGLVIGPVVGVFVLLGIAFWLAERKAKHKPPVE